MNWKQTASATGIAALLITGCSKKHSPQVTVVEKPVETKVVVKKKVKIPTPKIITVDDRAARHTPDGRMYYDFEGKRYWRNYDDGKYYLYNRDMYNNPAYKPH